MTNLSQWPTAYPSARPHWLLRELSATSGSCAHIGTAEPPILLFATSGVMPFPTSRHAQKTHPSGQTAGSHWLSDLSEKEKKMYASRGVLLFCNQN